MTLLVIGLEGVHLISKIHHGMIDSHKGGKITSTSSHQLKTCILLEFRPFHFKIQIKIQDSDTVKLRFNRFEGTNHYFSLLPISVIAIWRIKEKEPGDQGHIRWSEVSATLGSLERGSTVRPCHLIVSLVRSSVCRIAVLSVHILERIS